MENVPHQQATATTRQDSSRVAAADKNAINDRLYYVRYNSDLLFDPGRGWPGYKRRSTGSLKARD